MKELTLKEIQQESLKILIEVDAFCERNGIRYSLAYGTMIGAVRRPDYDRFCKSFRSDRYGIISSHDPGCYINYCHIFDDRDTVFHSTFALAEGFHGGVWIDVFPLDGAPDDHAEFEAKMLKMSKRTCCRWV